MKQSTQKSRPQKRSTKPKGPSQRQLRAGELIRHALVDVMAREEFTEPALNNVSVTISEVRASPDLRHADIYCVPLGAKTINLDEAEILKALNKVAPFVRGLLGREINMKFTPTLKFRKDESFDEASRIDALLATPEVARDLASVDDSGDT